jgi:predicted nucleic acid-binding protein
MAITAAQPLGKVALDTGPLYSVLTLMFASQNPSNRNAILSKNKLLDYLRDPKAQQNFLLLFTHLRTVLTTSHVIGELKGRQKLKDRYAHEFWRCAISVLRIKSVDERLIRLLDLPPESLDALVPIIGPTDAGLIELAKKEQCVLLTDDRELARFSKAANTKFQLIEDLVHW